MTDVYAIFHLNLLYSSIPPGLRREVVSNSYWPLLQLAESCAPICVEATAETLVAIESVDNDWLPELRRLLQAKRVSFVGSGYAQVIGPLVPWNVNQANLTLGQQAYREMLRQVPTCGYVNEQAWSGGILPAYAEAGYEAVVMEWNNPASAHPEWPRALRYLPQRVRGADETVLGLIWNDTVAFQALQSCVHGTLDLDHYLDTMRRRMNYRAGVFPVYGSDTEIFDFRPGRYATEAAVRGGEWGRLRLALEGLRSAGYALCSIDDVLGHLDDPGAGTVLRLETPEQPIPVKKQPKYNAVTWAVPGRDNLTVNTACWRRWRHLIDTSGDPGAWTELCSDWASDYRTHITDDRWRALLANLAPELATGWTGRVETRRVQDLPADVRHQGRWLDVTTPTSAVRINTGRGLALDSVIWPGMSPRPVLGTLPRGFFERIDLAADFYTGVLTLEVPGVVRITDLAPVDHTVGISTDGSAIVIDAALDTPYGYVYKQIVIQTLAPELEIRYDFDLRGLPAASIRVCGATLIPGCFDQDTLYYATHNGGAHLETFSVTGRTISHGAPVSSLVSASTALGATQGIVVIGDAERQIRISVDSTISAAVPMISYVEDLAGFLFRVHWSIAEYDDTVVRPKDLRRGLVLRLAPHVPLGITSPAGPG